MKLTNLALVLLRLLGLYFMVQGVAGAISAVVYSTMLFADEASYTAVSTLAFPASRFAWSSVSLLLGLYFFFGARKVVANVIEGTGPHCNRCGFDMSGVPGGQCPECGAPPAGAEQ